MNGYIAVCLGDLAVAMLRPKEFTQLLVDKYKFQLKGTGIISLHLGPKQVLPGYILFGHGQHVPIVTDTLAHTARTVSTVSPKLKLVVYSDLIGCSFLYKYMAVYADDLAIVTENNEV